jgi:hypothetical protein
VKLHYTKKIREEFWDLLTSAMDNMITILPCLNEGSLVPALARIPDQDDTWNCPYFVHKDSILDVYADNPKNPVNKAVDGVYQHICEDDDMSDYDTCIACALETVQKVIIDGETYFGFDDWSAPILNNMEAHEALQMYELYVKEDMFVQEDGHVKARIAELEARIAQLKKNLQPTIVDFAHECMRRP